MPRLAVLVLLCLTLPVVPAFAGFFGGGDGGLAAGRATVAECDDAHAVEYVTAGGEVTAVIVRGIADPGCSGGRLSVALTATGVGVAEGGPVTVPSDGDSVDDEVTVTVTPGARASEVDRADVLIEEPS